MYSARISSLHKLLRGLVISVVLVTGLTVVAGVAEAELTIAERTRREVVVATAGARKITVGELEDRVAQVPSFQLVLFGANGSEVKRSFLERVLLREALFEQGAAQRHIGDDSLVQKRLQRARSASMLRHIELEAKRPDAFSKDEVVALYNERKSHFQMPARIAVWRILCRTKQEASEVLAEAQKAGTPARFAELAREKSLDKATALRGGNLGFLAEDGSGQEPTVRVDRAIYAAASKVKDGELVAEVVPEGEAFAVVWRRGSTEGRKQTVTDVEAELRQTLFRNDVDTLTKTHLDGLRKLHVQLIDTAPFAGLTVDLGDPLLGPRNPPKLAASKSSR